MSVKGLLWRFAALYVGLMLLVVAAVGLLGVRPSSGLNTVALLGAVGGAGFWFTRQNRRQPDAHERRRAVVGMWVMDLLLQMGVALVAAAATGAGLAAGSFLAAFGFIAALHGVIVYLIFRLICKLALAVP